MNYKKIFLIALMCATISCASAKIKKLVILHTNDTHRVRHTIPCSAAMWRLVS